MIIYYKCNFKLGKGYYISSYDTVGKHQKIILEKDDIIRQNMSNSIAYAFMTQVGRSMYLASDEDGNLFVGVFGLIGGNYDKYVNAVFCDNNKDLMCKVFSYFCNHYSIANQMLLDSVMRNDEVEQGYLVNEEITLDLYNRFIEEENGCICLTKQKRNHIYHSLDLILFRPQGNISLHLLFFV